MPMIAKITALVARKETLEDEIHQEMAHRAVDFARVAKLKKQKMLISEKLSHMRFIDGAGAT